MKLAETNYENSETGCCARLDVARWDGQEVKWRDRPFLRDHIRAFLHIPLNFGSVITRDNAVIEGADAYPEEPLSLTDEVSPWNSPTATTKCKQTSTKPWLKATVRKPSASTGTSSNRSRGSQHSGWRCPRVRSGTSTLGTASVLMRGSRNSRIAELEKFLEDPAEVEG